MIPLFITLFPLESKAPSKKSIIETQPGGGFKIGLSSTSTTSVGSGGFKFGGFGGSTTSNTSSSVTGFGQAATNKDLSSSSQGGFQSKPGGGFSFGIATSSNSSISGVPSSATPSFTFGQPISKPGTDSTPSTAIFKFGSAMEPVKTTDASDSTVVTSSPLLNKDSTANVQPVISSQSNVFRDSSLGGFKFGGSPLLSQHPSHTSITTSLVSSTSVQSTFKCETSQVKFGQPAASTTTKASEAVAPKPPSLFTFGAPVSTSAPAVGLGMANPSMNFAAPMVNGGFGSVHDDSKLKPALGIGFGAGRCIFFLNLFTFKKLAVRRLCGGNVLKKEMCY